MIWTPPTRFNQTRVDKKGTVPLTPLKLPAGYNPRVIYPRTPHKTRLVPGWANTPCAPPVGICANKPRRGNEVLRDSTGTSLAFFGGGGLQSSVCVPLCPRRQEHFRVKLEKPGWWVGLWGQVGGWWCWRWCSTAFNVGISLFY